MSMQKCRGGTRMPDIICATVGYTTMMGCIHHTILSLVTRPFLQTIHPLVRRAAPTPLAIASTTWPLHTTSMTVRDIMMRRRLYIQPLDRLWRISMTTDLYLRFSWQLRLRNRNSSSGIRSRHTWMGIACTNDTRRPILRFTLWQNRHCAPNSLKTPNRRPRTTTMTTAAAAARVSHRIHQTSPSGPNLRACLVQDHVRLKSKVRGVDSPQLAKSNRVASSILCASSHCPTGPRGSTRKSRHSPTIHPVDRQRERAGTLLVLRRHLGRGMAIINSRVPWRTRFITCLVDMLQTRIGRDWIDRFCGFLARGVFDGCFFFVVYRRLYFCDLSFLEGNSISHFMVPDEFR